jgi:hypothetical protein
MYRQYFKETRLLFMDYVKAFDMVKLKFYVEN